MEICTECGNRLVGGHLLLNHTGPPGMLTYEYECGHCGHWWFEDEPAPVVDWHNRPTLKSRVRKVTTPIV